MNKCRQTKLHYPTDKDFQDDSRVLSTLGTTEAWIKVFTGV